MPAPAIVWFRRDLRLADLPTLLAARDRSTQALAVFVLDDALLRPSGTPRTTFLTGCLRALDTDLGGRLLVVRGDPAEAIPRIAHAIDADSVHISADHGPYGMRRDDAVESALAASSVPIIRTGSPYAVSPGRISTKAGTPYKVFTSYRRGWLEHGWHSPAATTADTLAWLDPDALSPSNTHRRLADLPPRVGLAELPHPGDHTDGPTLPPAGEAAALRRWRTFRDERLTGYDTHRDRPDKDATTGLSPYLKFGCIHPRTVLHDLRDSPGSAASVLRSELAWRDFYADVLFHRPDTARRNYNVRFDAMRYDAGLDAEAAFDAWRGGRTGYPIVDAGMRQLLGQGWMHNRVRMITASFLTKDLHLPWWRGARHFMTHLVDGDLASNQHGWQWTAGCGTDAAPYFRVFNPITQGERFDPDGDYVRRWVPELRHIGGKAVHRPWARGADESLFSADNPAYPPPIVDHAEERVVALARFGELR